MIKNSSKFRQPSIHFQKYGYYTSAPKGTTAFRDFWNEESKKCLYGFVADDGDYITGYHYFYLNYTMISIVEEVDVIIGGVSRKVAQKHRGFPTFYDSDYEYFHYIEQAEKLGKHAVVLKKRRAGYSWKAASMLCRNFYLLPGSAGYAVASEAEFLTKDGILTKSWDLMSWIDANTAWTKKRQKVDTRMHKRASYIVDNNGTKIEAGFLSEIMGVTVKNDVQKIRGKAGKLILFEEAGKFPGLKEAWQIARPSVEQGTNVFGTLIAYGTGGTEDADYEGLKDLFYEIEAYNVLGVDNIWDEGGTKKCGFFVPEYVNMEGTDEEGNPFMDEDGNSLKEVAMRHILKERQKIFENATDKTAIDRYIAEHPLNGQEACLQISGNIFPKKDLIQQLSYIRNTDSIKSYKQVGELYQDSAGIIKWNQIDSKFKDITKYRIEKGQSKEGAIVIWEHPEPNPPWGLYVAGLDPYDHDQANSSDSLGSCFIYKRFMSNAKTYNWIVAEYTGRPDTAEQYYENVRLLLLYYNATCLYENQWPGFSVYMRNKHYDYLLADQPGVISKMIKDSRVQRGKGIHMVTDIKNNAELWLKDWLTEEYEPGKKNLTKIFSEGLLEELISYNNKGNFDRVISIFLIMIYLQELQNLHIKSSDEISKIKRLFESPIFSSDREFTSFN